MTQTENTGCPFDPLGDDYLADPVPFMASAREAAPVFHSPELGYWVVTRYAEIDAVFRDPATFSAANAQAPLFPPGPEVGHILADGGFNPPKTMSNLDPPEHSRIRVHTTKAFSVRRMAALEPAIKAKLASLLDGWGDPAVPGRAEVVGMLTFPLPAQVIFTMIGFPPEDTEMLKSWGGDRLALSWGRPSPDEAVAVAHNMVAYWRYCQSFVGRRLFNRADDLTSDLLELRDEDPSTFSIEEVASIVYGLSFAGHETTMNLMANTIRRVLERRDVWTRLCADLSRIPDAVEETLRFDSSVITWRRVTTRATTIGGVDVPAGANLLLLLAGAGRDPAQFADADTFDLDRPNNRTHLAFGKGTHYCLGANLARRQIGAAIEALTVRFPSLRLVPDQQLSFDRNVSFRGPKQLWVEWG